jgi:hypothetical protein
MKKALYIPFLVTLVACGNGEGVEKNGNSNVPGDAETSTPSAIDTAQHPNGMSNGSVISRDTAAMRVDSTVRR